MKNSLSTTLVLALILAQSMTGQTVSAQSGAAEFIVSTEPLLLSGNRMNLQLQFVSDSDSIFWRIVDVSGDANAGIDIRVISERTAEVDGPEVTLRRQPLTLDQLPAGNYPLRLVDAGNDNVLLDELEVVVSQDDAFNLAAPVRLWPALPTTMDQVWLLLDVPDQCESVQLLAFVDTSERITLLRQPPDCSGLANVPQLQAVPLGTLSEQDQQMQLIVSASEQSAGDLTAAFRLRVEQRLPASMAGSWSDPEQSGHGINLEMLPGDRIGLSWFSFNQLGDPAWLIAVGDHVGLTATLQATIVSGGVFPPDFNPDLIERSPWGTIELTFSSCNTGSMRWQTLADGFIDGEMRLSRITSNPGQSCSGSPPAAALRPAWYQGDGSFFRLPSGTSLP